LYAALKKEDHALAQAITAHSVLIFTPHHQPKAIILGVGIFLREES